MFRGVTGIFFWGGKVIFPDFFPGRKFPVWLTQNKFPSFSKVKSKKKKKKKKKKVLTSFYNVSLLPFQIFHLFLLNFHPFSLFLPCLFFPDTSAKISRSEVSGGHSTPCPPPRLLRHCKRCAPMTCLISYNARSKLKFNQTHFMHTH